MDCFIQEVKVSVGVFQKEYNQRVVVVEFVVEFINKSKCSVQVLKMSSMKHRHNVDLMQSVLKILPGSS